MKKMVKEEKAKKALKECIICLSGIDGTGKTTLAKKLVDELSSSGIKCKYVWFRNARFLCLPFLAFCYLTGYAKSIKLQNVRVGEYYFYKNKFIAFLWLWLLTFDMLFLSLWKVFLPLKRGYTLVVDRYILDATTDMMCNTRTNNPHALPIKLLFKFMPENTLNILLDSDEEKAFQRKSDILSLKYLKERRKVYLKLAQEFKVPVINADQPLNAVWESIVGFCRNKGIL